MSRKPLSYSESWSRGWRVVGMVIVIQIFVGISVFPLQFLPESIREIVGLVLLITLGPALSYWVFGMFYPDYEPKPKLPESEPSSCVLCQTVIPSGADTCPSCGWTYKSKSK